MMDGTSKEKGPETGKKSNVKLRDIKSAKVVIRRLPPNLTKEEFLEHISPIPDNDYCHFVAPDHSLGQNAFSRAYINFSNVDDISIFCEKFDGYVFVDSKGNELPAVVEYAPFQKSPKKRKRSDLRKGTIDQDADYKYFLEKLANPETEISTPIEKYVEEIEAKEKELKANHGISKQSTPLLDYIKRRRDEKRAARQRAIDERKRREIERRKQKEEERKKRREHAKEKPKEKDMKDAEKDNSADTPVKILRKMEGKGGSSAGRGDNQHQKSEKTSKGRDIDGHEKEEGFNSRSSPSREGHYKSGRDRDRRRSKMQSSQNRDKTEQYSSSASDRSGYRGNQYDSRDRSKYEKVHGKSSNSKDQKTASKESSNSTVETQDTSEGASGSKVGSDKSGGSRSGTEESKDKQAATRNRTGDNRNTETSKSRVRNKDRPERAIYVPGKRAADKRKEEERQREKKDEEQKSKNSTKAD